MITRLAAASKKKKEEKKTTSPKKKVAKQQAPPNEESEEEEEEEQDIDEFYEDEYELPKSITSNEKLLEESNKIIKKLEDDSPSLEKILNANIRWKHKVELFEWFFIYKYSYPNSEERIMLKKDLNSRLKRYKQDKIDFKKNKNQIKLMENIMDSEDELQLLKRKILNLNANEKNKRVLFQKYHELVSKGYEDEEYFKLLSWLRLATQLPYQELHPFENDHQAILTKMKSYLDNTLYGMDSVKEQLLLFTHNKLKYPKFQSHCLGLIGPPGVGKTSVAKCLSNVLDLPFEQISFGGVSNAEYIKGHDFTYIGSKPGEIALSMIRMKKKNGIMFFDEFEKINENQNVVNAMLHITDNTQNAEFKDNFFGDLRIDLSNIWFICSMNEKPIDKALSDRIFYIDVKGYSKKEKVQIVEKYTLPKVLKNIGLEKDDIKIPENIIEKIVDKVSSSEEGVRRLNQGINVLISKLSFLYHNQDKIKMSFMLPESYFPLSLPIVVNEIMISKLLKDFTPTISPSLMSMYV
jgi:ATP-dependent Lon protease